VQALEDEIRRRPDDWASWLVYADWLSEQGDPRGRLIGLEHRRETAALDADELRKLKAEMAELVAVHGASWHVSDAPEGWKFERRCGLIVGLSLLLDEKNIAQLDEFLHDPRASLLLTLRVNSSRERDDDDDGEYDPDREPAPVPEQLLRALFELELGRLRELAFPYTPIGASGAALLARWPGLPQLAKLEALKLQRNRIGPTGMRALAVAGRLDRLLHLNLRENPIGPLGAAMLAGSANFSRLESLHVHLDDVGVAGARSLADSEHLPLRIRRAWAGRWSEVQEHTSDE
jgi:uncharacterized protein (TIGR02996 family)